MKAVVYKGPMRLDVETVPNPVCPPDGLILQVKACGICGSDLRTYLHGHPKVTPPYILGHEAAGVVAEVGSAVTDYSLGQALAIAPNVFCGQCYFCKRGIQNLCVGLREIGQSYPGGMAEYMPLSSDVLQRGIVHSFDRGKISFAEATLAEPSSSVMNAQSAAAIGPEDTVVIVGSGPVGCLHIEVARARGARQVICLELSESRRQLAKGFGADLVADPCSVDAAALVRERTAGLGADIVIVACPSDSAQSEAIDLVRKGGQIILFGGLPMTKPTATFNSNKIHYNEITVRGAFAYPARQHLAALHFMAMGKITARRYITHKMALERIAEAMELMRAGEALKVVLEP